MLCRERGNNLMSSWSGRAGMPVNWWDITLWDISNDPGLEGDTGDI